MRTTMAICVLMVTWAAAAAAQPVHDECANALPVAQGLTPGSTAGATASSITGSCASFGGTIGADVWYAFTATEDALLVASLGAGGGTADFDTVLAVFSGSCGALVEQACNDDAIGLASQLTLLVSAGTTYLIEVGGWNGDSGDFTLSLSTVPAGAPPNDKCSGATPIGEGLVTQSNIFATTAATTPPCTFGGAPATHDLWYLYTPPSDGIVRASLVSGGGAADFDTVLAVWTGACGAGLALVDCNDDAGPFTLGSEVVFPASAGTPYRIEVSGYAGATGIFTLAVDFAPPAPNDECSAALPVRPGLVAGSTLGATDSAQSATCAFGGATTGHDVWYRFEAEESGLLRASTAALGGGSADFDTVIAIFSGECGRAVELACNDDADGTLQSDVAVPVSAGAAYEICVGGFESSVGTFTLNVSFTGEPAGPDVVLAEQKISSTQGGFTGDLSSGLASFGASVAALGDLDGDGVPELAVGSPFEQLGAPDSGAVWILFLNADGSVRAHQRIATGEGGMIDATGPQAEFGSGVAGLGDLDGDGVPDLAVGAAGDDDGGPGHGAVWILFLRTDGTVKAARKISDTAGGFTGNLKDDNGFGFALARLGDLDGDGVTELVSGAPFTFDGGEQRGAVWVLFLNADGTVKAHQRISDIIGAFTGVLGDGDRFGAGVAALGDVDGDGLLDLAVGAPGDDDGGIDRGAVWVLRLKLDGKVKSWLKIASETSGLQGLLFDGSLLGQGLAAIGDPDGNGVADLAVGSTGDPDGGPLHGAVRLLLLDPGGAVRTQAKISDTQGGFQGVLEDATFWGEALAGLGDLDGDGREDLAVGSRFDNDGGPWRGAVWVLRLDAANKWVDLGHGLPGATSIPHLIGSGTLHGDTEVRLTLRRAAPSAPVLFVLGLAEGPVPFLGGTLVPVPAIVDASHVTDEDGILALTGRWPVGLPAGLFFAFHCWVADAAGPQGFAASNALGVTTP